jgi:hypothetical protein
MSQEKNKYRGWAVEGCGKREEISWGFPFWELLVARKSKSPPLISPKDSEVRMGQSPQGNFLDSG